jgi:hypothetical protein
MQARPSPSRPTRFCCGDKAGLAIIGIVAAILPKVTGDY